MLSLTRNPHLSQKRETWAPRSNMTKHPKEADRLRKIVESFPKITVTVLGDLVADEFVFGEISRVSREAPVLILRHRERSVAPGGAANAANKQRRGLFDHQALAASSFQRVNFG